MRAVSYLQVFVHGIPNLEFQDNILVRTEMNGPEGTQYRAVIADFGASEFDDTITAE